jgi:hypothetical protein
LDGAFLTSGTATLGHRALLGAWFGGVGSPAHQVTVRGYGAADVVEARLNLTLGAALLHAVL